MLRIDFIAYERSKVIDKINVARFARYNKMRHFLVNFQHCDYVRVCVQQNTCSCTDISCWCTNAWKNHLLHQ